MVSIIILFFFLFSGLVVTEDNFKVKVEEISEAEVVVVVEVVVAVVVVVLFQKLEVTRDRFIFGVDFDTKLFPCRSDVQNTEYMNGVDIVRKQADTVMW